MVEKRKTKAIAAKRQRARREISLSIEEKKNYESDTADERDPDQANNDKNHCNSERGGPREDTSN